ncbi:hypothetical protein MKQ68_02385 [Chitinophaga horti]|uniref:Lipoprotein n=1 Tax=Chitinophaga horti TaxID=2920382 RepID=A0ABY6J2S1_9BACT|nr:hypothetical protein [Chitinophaga horti]UYQ93942.1 hypothetical protein MKQ68_02385 [Chitinophaga horti]
MKNVLKASFFALALGLFAASCNNASKPAEDSTAVAPIDSAAVTPVPVDTAAVVDTTTVVDSAAAPAPAAH